MPEKWQEKTTLIVQDQDLQDNFNAYRRFKTITLPPTIDNIADTRHWLLHECPWLEDESLCMMDDDLVFSARRTDEPTKFRNMTDADWDYMMYDLTARVCNQRPHVGISHREGANRNIDPYVEVGRQMRVLAYHKPTLKEECIAFGRIPVMEDFDTTLQLLRRGYPNLLINNYVHNQGGSDASGGCSTFRTPEMQNAAAVRLAELHPSFVKVRTVPPRGGWKYERKDVTVYWKKAFQSFTGVPYEFE